MLKPPALHRNTRISHLHQKRTFSFQGFSTLWLPPLLWMALIYWLSAQSQLPGLTITWLDWMLKHAGHFGGYAILALLWWRVTRRNIQDRRAAAALAFFGAFLYAAFDEIHQSSVPGRDASLLDLAIDAAGSAIAMGIALWKCPVERQPDVS